MEVIDIGVDNLDPISVNLNDSNNNESSKVNFGPGIELLMNEKNTASYPKEK